MLTDISFIVAARDDGYMGNFMERFSTMLDQNISLLDSNFVDYEIIVVDFNPLNEKYLYLNDSLKMFLSHPCVKNIIVDQSVLISDNLPRNSFYEYFAKNIGARKSKGKMLFFFNSDIIITFPIIDYIKDQLTRDDVHNNFYRCRYRNDRDLYTGGVYRQDLYNPADEDGFLCGGYSGDATFMHRDVFIKKSTGYNEKEEVHRLGSGQTGMDGEILWNLYLKGVNPVITELEYYHVRHPRDGSKNYAYYQEKYTNREGWGYIKYPIKNINSNTIMIYSKGV